MELKQWVTGVAAVLLGVPLAGATAAHENGAERYGQIVSANIFKLGRPPENTKPKETIVLTKIRLSGIVTYLAAKRVLLEVTSGSPGAPGNRRTSYLLAEGERADDITIVRVDEQAATAEVSYEGTRIRLALK